MNFQAYAVCILMRSYALHDVLWCWKGCFSTKAVPSKCASNRNALDLAIFQHWRGGFRAAQGIRGKCFKCFKHICSDDSWWSLDVLPRPQGPKRAYYWHHLLIRTSGRYLQYLNLGHNTSFWEVSTQKAEFLKGQHSSFKGFVWYYWLCCIVLLYSALHIIDIAYIIAKGLRSPVQDSLASRETAKSSGAVAIGKCIYVYVRCSFCACFFSFWRRVVCHFRKLLTMRGELHSFYQLVMYGDANHFFCPANSLQRFLQPLICKLHDLGRWNRKSYIWRLSHTKGTRFAHCWLILLHLIVCSFIQLQRCHALPITNDSQPKCVYECLCIEVHGCQWMFTVM